MTIIALTENKKTLSMSAFDRDGNLVAGNFVIKMELMNFKQVLETIGSYVGQHLSNKSHPGVVIQVECSSLIDFLTKELANAGLPIMAVPGEAHSDMAQNVIAYLEEQRAANSEPEAPTMTEEAELVDEVTPKPAKPRRRNRGRNSRKSKAQ